MNFHYLARGIIYKDNKVLLAHQKGADHTFLPGGHIMMGEKAEPALRREIEEELGEQAIVKRLVGAVEATWVEDGQDNHEINLVFEADIPNLSPSQPPHSRESHLEFIWAAPADLPVHNLQPYPLVECLMKWENGYHAYWGSAFS